MLRKSGSEAELRMWLEVGDGDGVTWGKRVALDADEERLHVMGQDVISCSRGNDLAIVLPVVYMYIAHPVNETPS